MKSSTETQPKVEYGASAELHDLSEEFGREQAQNVPWNRGNAWNHAEILGEPSPEFDALMRQPASLIRKEWSRKNPPERG